MILTKYDTYKDSGVDWLGEIPVSWKSYRFKDISLIQTSNVDKKTNENEEEVLLCNYVDVYKNDFITKSLNFMKATAKKGQINKFKLSKNDVIITKDSETAEDMAEPALVVEDLKNIICGYHLALVKSKKDFVNNKYIFRLFQSSDFHWNFIVKSKGVTRVGLSINNAVNNQELFLPPILEQIKISNFLDKKTSQIDKKNKLLQEKKESHEELKKSLINEIVCRGINKNVELKDSGVEWIGKIPKHWKVERLRGFCKVSTSSVNKKINENEKLVKLVNYTNVYGNLAKEIYNNSNYMVVSANNQQRNEKKLIMGDVLFTPSSETIEDIGVSSVVMENLNNTLYSYHLVRARFFKNINNGFKKYLFNNDIVQYYFSKSAKGTTRQILNLNVFNNLIIVLPPKEEQIQIANYLDKKTFKIDKIVSKISDQIKTLKEFRKTLINDVVTGKVKIQDE